MNLSRLLISLLLVLFVPWAAGAADGDSCTSNRHFRPQSYNVQCVMLCDSDVDPGGACSEFRFVGVPDILQIEIAEDDGCTAALTATFTTRGDTATDSHTLPAWTLTRGVMTALTIEGTTNMPLTYITPTLGTATNCTDIDLKMHVYYRR